MKVFVGNVKRESENLLNYNAPGCSISIFVLFILVIYLRDLAKFCEYRLTLCTWAIYQRAKSLHQLFIPTFYKKLLAGN